jgi:porin
MMKASLPDRGRKHRTEPGPPVPNRLVADIDSPLEQNILNLSQRQRIADIHHHHEADHLGRAVEITEGIAHRRRLRILARRLKPIYSDNALHDHHGPDMIFKDKFSLAASAASARTSSLPTDELRIYRTRPRSIARIICATALFVFVFGERSWAQTGPSSVAVQLRTDQEAAGAPGRVLPAIPAKVWLERSLGLTLGADYNVLLQHASMSPGANDAVGGAARLYGEWKPFNRSAVNASSLVFKVENRHRIETPIAPKELGPAVGYSGLTAVPFSDAGNLLTNLYWHQRYRENRFAFVAGIVDVTDYVNVYGLVNQWTDFSNLAFSTDPTIPAPDQGLGAAALVRITPNYYVLGGLADANGDPSDPGNAIDSFFDTHELFKHIEVGWIESWENRHWDNIHITAWQADAREAAQVDEGWGLAVSLSRQFNDRWTPFLRAGYSEGAGAILARSVSTGIGYRLNERNDYVGLGANWGRPPTDATEREAEDQYTFEAYYRLNVLPEVAVTPDVQFIVNPALDPTEDSLWVLGLRLRATM